MGPGPCSFASTFWGGCVLEYRRVEKAWVGSLGEECARDIARDENFGMVELVKR